MTRAERTAAIDQILAECPNINSDLIVIETIHRLGFTVSGIGYEPIALALDEARAQLEQKEVA